MRPARSGEPTDALRIRRVPYVRDRRPTGAAALSGHRPGCGCVGGGTPTLGPVRVWLPDSAALAKAAGSPPPGLHGLRFVPYRAVPRASGPLMEKSNERRRLVNRYGLGLEP